MKRIFFISVLLALILPVNAFSYTISVNQFVEHPSLNASIDGFKDALKDAGVDVQYNMHNAQANMPTVLQIVNQIRDEKPDLILAVATPSAQTTVQKIKDIPILFTAVTDPVIAGLVSSLENPGRNVSGTTDIGPIKEQLALIKTLQPYAKNIGIIFNAGEANSVVQLDLAKAVAKNLNLSIVEAATPNTSGVYQAAKSLVGRVDAIYLPTDNTVISAMEPIAKVGAENKIPVYSAEASTVHRGAVASQSIDYYKLGRQTGELAVKILNEKVDPGTLPVESLKNTSLIINLVAASKMGLTISDDVIAKADEVIR